jgi:hypothetical protein
MGCYDPDKAKSGKRKQMITVKCRDEKLGLEVHLKARADTKFSTIMYHYRTKFNIEDVTFMYQEKKLEGQQSPYSLGMDDNTIIFVHNDFTKEELAAMVWDSKKWRWVPPPKGGEASTYQNNEPSANYRRPESATDSSSDISSVNSLMVDEADLPVVG